MSRRLSLLPEIGATGVRSFRRLVAPVQAYVSAEPSRIPTALIVRNV